jgi:hypothetical protein
MVEKITRRTVVRTGAKLAYAAPLVAASIGTRSAGATAVSGGAVTCAGFSFKLTHVDGSVACGNGFSLNDAMCCDSDDDCTSPDFEGYCLTSISEINGDVTFALVCPTDGSKGLCGGLT